jgi:SpoVK/Ycf46/Vps4 family AAA+-type ATPase
MSCYICDKSLWYDRKLEYDIDRDALVEFTLLYESETKTLDSIIKLADAYKIIKLDIIKCVETAHKKCKGICDSCGQSCDDLPAKKKSKPDISWVAILDYYLDINESSQKILDKLHNMRKEINDINIMIGMENLKEMFLRLVKTLAKIDRMAFPGYMNMVISGPPGHGKTEIAKLLGNALAKSGFLTSNTFVQAKRADLIGRYCGETAKCTTQMFDKARGGVLFIDEVYSLGNARKQDVFTGECIDTINLLTGERRDTVCFIAGYKHEIDDRFFVYNVGLKRRFPWRFDIDTYTPQSLVDIFFKMLREHNITAFNTEIFSVTDIKPDYFTSAGGDIANLITNCITVHNDRCFLRFDDGIMTRADVVNGIAEFVRHRVQTIKTKAPSPPPPDMYI